MAALFVYGTLGPGRQNAHMLEDIGGHWQDAYVMGRLVEEGWGAEAGFPALVLDTADERVDGFLFTSGNLDAHWNMLDAFEGPEYQRLLTPVTLVCGGTVEAFVYALCATAR